MPTEVISREASDLSNNTRSKKGGFGDGPSVRLLFGVGLATALVYWLFRSCSLDEWDSVLFAMGVQEFDLSKHQPHPPGYPLYIFFGWLFSLAGLPIQGALVTISAITGGVFIATWLAIAWKWFGKSVAWPFAFALTGMIGVWLTAGKALTDTPSSAFLALEIWFCLRAREKRWALVFAGACGAIAAGFRPQNVGIALLLVVAARWLAGRSWKEVGAGVGVFALLCLAWLVPMMAIQAEAMGTGNWFAYFERVNDQWTSRFKRPNTFIGAGDWSPGFLLARFAKHFGWSWFYLGFGFDPRVVTGWLGYAALLAGAVGFLAAWKRGTARSGNFWKWQLLWAIPYVLTIFICLPADPRYYVPVFPLLVMVAILGFREIKAQWLAWSFGAVLWVIAFPLAWQMHTQMPPPVQAVEWLRQQHPKEERGKPWIWLNDSYRHAIWYAPEFNHHSIVETEVPPPGTKIYSDIAQLPRRLGTVTRATEIARFSRPKTIHRKHETVVLYELEYDPKVKKGRRAEPAEEVGQGPAAAQP